MDMIQRQKDIEEVIKKFCQSQDLDSIGLDYAEYERAFAFTNENLFELYHKARKDRYKSALCVLASGDHVFNLIYHGVNHIDTFDCNRVTEYYALGFKKTALEVLEYDEFYDLFIHKNRSIEDYVIDAMPEEYKLFWHEFLEARKSVDNNASVFDITRGKDSVEAEVYNYYFHKNSFYTLKSKLKEAEITFTCADIKEVPQKFLNYDFIILSTILTYSYEVFGYANCQKDVVKLIKKIYQNNLNALGELIYDYKYFAASTYDNIYSKINFGRKLIREVNGGTAMCIQKGSD